MNFMNEYNMDQEIQIEGLTEKEVKELSDIIKRFVNSYIKKDKSMTPSPTESEGSSYLLLEAIFNKEHKSL